MNDNLAEMINITDDATENENIEIPETVEETPVSATEETPVVNNEEKVFDIETISLSSWFMNNKDNFGDDINHVKAKIKRVNPDEDLILTVPHPDGGLAEDGESARKIIIFDKAHITPVLNLKGIGMSVFNHNVFRIIYETPIEGIFIKYYGVTARNVVFCKQVEDMLIPYAIEKLKKNDEGLNMVLYEENIEDKLNAAVSIEDIILRYKQIEKHQEGLATNKDVIAYFQSKIKTVIDVNHLLQIDNVIITLVS